MKVKSIESIRAQFWCDVYLNRLRDGDPASFADFSLDEFDKRFRDDMEAFYSKYVCLHEWEHEYDQYGDVAWNKCKKCSLTKELKN